MRDGTDAAALLAGVVVKRDWGGRRDVRGARYRRFDV